MAQHDQVLANQAGASFRGDANSALAALFSNSSGATEPSTMIAYQFWGDTTTGILKQRNAANTAWISLWTMATGVMAANAALAGSASQDFTTKKLTVSQTEGIVGTTTNNNVQAGGVGEYIESVVGNTNAPTASSYGDLTSIALTAGDWDISAVAIGYKNDGDASSTSAGIGTVTGNNSTGLVLGSNKIEWNPTNDPINGMSIPAYRVSLAGSTTYYLKMYAVYTTGTPIFRGRLSARRVR